MLDLNTCKWGSDEEHLELELLSLCFSLTCISSSVFLMFDTDPRLRQAVENEENSYSLGDGQNHRNSLWSAGALVWVPLITVQAHAVATRRLPNHSVSSNKNFKYRVHAFIVSEIKLETDVIIAFLTQTQSLQQTFAEGGIQASSLECFSSSWMEVWGNTEVVNSSPPEVLHPF